MCPLCGSLERHRFLAQQFPAAPGLTLDVGVYRGFLRRLVLARGGSYVGVDVVPGPEVDVVADVTSLPFSDEEFETVVCSHVLEHVVEDRAAIEELARVLAPGGICFLMFPHDENLAETLEDPSVVTSADRERVYGQRDHVRIYGRDRLERVEPTFEVDTLDFANGTDRLYVCAKRSRVV